MPVSLNARLERNEEEEPTFPTDIPGGGAPVTANHARVMEGVDRFKTVFKEGDDFRQPQHPGTN